MTAVTAELTGGVLTVTLNRPEQRNALSIEVQRRLAELWAATRSDPQVRCVLLTGSGRTFCAGADRADLTAIAAEGFQRIPYCPAEQLDVPVLVAVNGPCIGAGLRLFADADLAIASDTAWFSDPHVTIGLLGTPVAVQLAAKGSSPAVAQLFLSGMRFRMPAAQALAAGLLSEVVAEGELAARASAVAAEIAAQSPAAVRATVAALRRQHRVAMGSELDRSWAEEVAHRRHPDAAEGARALAAGRLPAWLSDPVAEPQP